MIWFRRRTHGLRSPNPELRRMLLAEPTLAELADVPDYDPDTPAARFHAAQASVLVGDRATARRHLHELLELDAATIQERLLAWNGLRELDELPSPAAGAAVRGVAVDSGTAAGLETLVAYEDGTARMLLTDGSVRAAGGPDSGCEAAIHALLAAARAVVEHTHPHRGTPEPAPDVHHTCIRVLTYAGTHIGIGPTPTLQDDPVGGPVLRALNELRAALRQPERQTAE